MAPNYLKNIASVVLLAVFISPSAYARKAHRKAPRLSADFVAAPEDQETCFSPEEPCDAKLVKFVSQATSSVDIAIYDINLDELVHALLVKSKQIRVRIVVDRKQAKGSHSAVPALVRAGANVKYGRQRGIMHNKFVIVDGKALETGSFNHTHHASESNNENQVYLTSPKVVERFKKRFEKIWADGEPAR